MMFHPPFVQAPPARYLGGGDVMVSFVDPKYVVPLCRAYGTAQPPGTQIESCYIPSQDRIIMPIPDNWSGAYAEMMAHEIAHHNGWPATHPTK